MSKNINQIHIVYFSGTGGTALAAKQLFNALKNKGVNAFISEIFQDQIPIVNSDELLILMYPVYAADAPQSVFNWISSIKHAKYGNATVISVSGGGEISPNTACRIRVIKRLEKKGFIVSNEYMLCMPSNFILPTGDILAKKLLEILPQKCEIIANDIIGKVQKRSKPFFRDKIISVFCQPEKIGAKVFGRTLKADDKCNACGLCAAKCPRGNINMINDKPEFSWKCVLCMRCVYACPQKAINTRILKKVILKEGFNIKSFKTQPDEKIHKAIDNNNSYLWKGVVKYLMDKENV